MLNKVREYISHHNLLDRNALHLVALSGGADSVCLLRMMQQQGYRLHAAHCNFHLRGEESDRDERFCKELCETCGIPFHIAHFDTRTYASLHGVSIEMAARELRYEYFAQLMEAIECEDVLVAHHSDDSIETALMNLMRGTGVAGLEGIKPVNGKVKRPLLCISREEVVEYLRSIGQDYITDSSNLEADVVRNKIRLQLLPLMEEVNPAVRHNILDTMCNVAEANKVLRQAIKQAVSRCTTAHGPKKCGVVLTISIPALQQEASPEMTLFEVLRDYGFSAPQIREIYNNMNAPSGRMWRSETHTLVSDRDALIIGQEAEMPVMRIPECGIYIYKVHEKIELSLMPKPKDFLPSKSAYCVTLDADAVRFPLMVKTVSQGERFSPFGMKGTKLVSDYLTDKKRNYFERQRQLALYDAQGEIIWLIGERVSKGAACNDDTINVLTVRYLYDE